METMNTDFDTENPLLRTDSNMFQQLLSLEHMQLISTI